MSPFSPNTFTSRILAISSNFRKFLFRLFDLENIVVPIQIDITNACNLACKHCYHFDHKNTGVLKFQDWKSILAQYKSLICDLNAAPHILICGGEPFTSPILIPLVQHIHLEFPSARIQILTNGTLITEQSLAPLDFYKTKLEFQISLDGFDKESHESLRGAQTFDRTINGLKLLTKNKFNTTVLTVLTKKASLSIERYFKLCSSLNVQQLNFTRFIPSGNGSKFARTNLENNMDLNSYLTAYLEILKFSALYDLKTNLKTPLLHFLSKKIGSYGHYGKAIVIDYRGNIKASSRVNLVLGNVFKDELRSVYLNNPILKSLRNGNIEGCKGCKFKLVCGGDRNAAFVDSGNILGPDPLCPSIFK